MGGWVCKPKHGGFLATCQGRGQHHNSQTMPLAVAHWRCIFLTHCDVGSAKLLLWFCRSTERTPRLKTRHIVFGRPARHTGSRPHSHSTPSHVVNTPSACITAFCCTCCCTKMADGMTAARLLRVPKNRKPPDFMPHFHAPLSSNNSL